MRARYLAPSMLITAGLTVFGLSGCPNTEPAPKTGSPVTRPRGSATPKPTVRPATPKPTGSSCVVAKVIDGDTVDIRCAGTKIRVRLIGIDTPEVYGGVECYGRQASSEAKRLLPVGSGVKMTPDPTQDKVDRYGRSLAYLTADGRDFGEQMLERGAAQVYVYRGSKFQKLSSYQRAQRLADARNAGLWGEC